MKLPLLTPFVLLSGFAPAASNDSKGGPVPMVFSGTEVGRALKALGMRTGIDVVYVADAQKRTVSLNVVAGSPEEGVQCLASAAGLAYHRVGKLYIVAAPAAMRQALQPYCIRTRIPGGGKAADLAASLAEAFPYATVRAEGDGVTAWATPDDAAAIRTTAETTRDAAAAGQSSADVILLSKAVPGTVATLLAGLYPDLKITPTPGDRPGGALALSGPAASLRNARETAQRLDVEPSGGDSILKVYTLRFASAADILDLLKRAAPKIEAFAGPQPYLPGRATFNPLTSALGSALGSGTGAPTSLPVTSAAGSLTGVADTAKDRATTIVLRGALADIETALRLVAEVDRKPKQIMVEVNVVETSPERDEDIGILYDWSSLNFSEASRGGSRPLGVGSFGRTGFDFTATLNAMVTKKVAKVLAKPSIRVVDNGQASVFIGDTLRARIVTGGALGAQNVEIREFPVGIILLIAPRVNADGNITMHVNPVVSTVTALDSSNVPQTSSREAETTAIVRDGETVVLGGLIRDEDVKTMQEIPLLSKLPFLGELFKNRSRNHRRSDILVSITPHIVDGDPEVKG